MFGPVQTILGLTEVSKAMILQDKPTHVALRYVRLSRSSLCNTLALFTHFRWNWGMWW